MQDELFRIWEHEKKTAILVTHNVDEAVYLADRIIVLTARPGEVKSIYDIELARPRKRTANLFIKTRAKILEALEEEINQS